MVDIFGASRYPIRQAIGEVKLLGLVDIVQGLGTFVRERPPVRRLARKRLSREKYEAGRSGGLTDAPEYDIRNLVLERGPAPVWISDLLQVPVGTEVIMRSRTIYLDDMPAQAGTSYWPVEVAEGTPFEQAKSVRGWWPYVLSEAKPEIVPGVTKDVLSARVPLPEEAAALAISPESGIAVVKLLQVAYDASGTPLFVDDVIHRGDLYEFEYEVQAG